MISNALVKRLIPAMAIAACVAIGAPLSTLAQGTPGLTIFSGVDRENLLSYRLDFNGRPHAFDRYRLNISRRKMNRAVTEFTVTYPDYYTGRFNPSRMEVRVNGDSVPLDEVVWDEEAREIKLYPVEVVQPNQDVEIVFSNVRNPRIGGTYYFNALTRSSDDLPLRRYLGTWIIDIGRP
ncbi:MAG: DUF2808 domain-containing protein [Kaiparowitsia implicata GSE-PSE-MK54-09C]|jgi:hypothetical protein|nr:DUF2808 domain-containing protein [Kaiparowitsia implicata GSE-PSE-MK54-09C]